eukprot:11193593-Lingulodinium_polyedra.AAC.1
MDDLVRRVAMKKVPKGAVMYRIDIKHFYMSGEPEKLVQACTKTIKNKKMRETARDVARYLLQHQYVQSKRLKGRLFRVTQGSGMGLIHSSSIADMALAVLGEIEFAADEKTKEKFEIFQYMRFEDDIFILATHRAKARAYIHHLQDLIKDVFELELVQVSARSVEMLAVELFIQKEILHAKIKPKASGPPLSSTSSHPKKCWNITQ